MSKEIAKKENTDLSLNENYTRDQIDLIKRTICKGATDDELQLFFYIAKKSGLDPLAKQIYAMKRWDSSSQRENMTVQTGIDGYRLIAARTNQHAGTDDAIFVVGNNGMPISATVKVHKLLGNQIISFSATARFSEYCQKKKDGSPTSFWIKMPFGQLAKCAEALALRKAFPQELSSIYTSEEMQQADLSEEKQPEEVLIKPEIIPLSVESRESILTVLNDAQDLEELKIVFTDAKRISKDDPEFLKEIVIAKDKKKADIEEKERKKFKDELADGYL